MLHGIHIDCLLLFWWTAGSLVAHAWRGDAEDDDTNTSEAKASEAKLKVYDVFSEAHDALLRAKQASLIQQNTGLLATRDALLHSLKDGKPAGTDSGGAGAAGHGNTTSLPYPYTSFVSSEPSAVDPSSQKPSAVNQSAPKQNPETPLREAVEPSEPSEKASRQTSPEIVPTVIGGGGAPTERLGLETQDEGEPRTAKDSAAMNWIGKDFSQYLSKVKYTVIRITAVTEEVNWFEPYAQPQANEYTGSGFAVYTDENCQKDPVFITNAHVVRDARDVQVQLPGIPGQKFFDAYVPLICEEYDLAVVQLIAPEKFLEALNDGKTQGLDSAKVHGKLQTLVVEDWPLVLGLEVASVGFPLGSTSLKLSRGVISGTEEVGDYMCYQTTAPISPGSSGGPLFALNGKDLLQVIGVTFASAASAGAQNTNYVVPTVSILQVINEFKRIKAMAQESPEEELIDAIQQRGKGGLSIEQAREEMAKMPKEQLNALVKKMSSNHHPFRIAPVDSEGVEANEALYQSERCEEFVGVYISKILSTSIFAHATKDSVLSPIPERCFLTAVGDIPLDHLGMGVTDSFLGDATPFQSLLMQKASEQRTVPISICKNGQTVPYQVNLTWNDEWYSMGVKDVVEPHYDKEAMDYEVFAGITLMQMSIQHIAKLLKWGGSPTVGRWLMPENQQDGHLLITHVQEGIYASRVLFAGMVVKEVNGVVVKNLEQLRKNFEPKDDKSYWQLVTDRDVVFMTDFVQALETQLDMAQEGLDFLMTPQVIESARKYLEHHHALPTDEDQRSKTLPQGNRSTATGNLGGVFTINIQVRNQRKDVRGGAAGINLQVPPYGVNRTGQQNRINATADTAQRVIRSSKGRSLIMRPSFPEEYTGSRSWQNLGKEPELEAHHQRAQVTGAGFAALAGVSRHGLSSLAETPL